MKHITLLAAMAIAGGTMAQRTATMAGHPVHSPFTFSAARTPTDTLVPPSIIASGSALVLYNTGTAGSYVAGTNTYGDKAKVQVFNSTGNVMVEQLLFLFGAKDEAGSPNSLIHARVYGLDGAGTNTADAAVTTAPGTVLGSVDIAISACDTSNLTAAMFSPAVSVSGNFGGGFDVSDLATGIELGLATTTNGNEPLDDQNWEKGSADTWTTMSNATSSWGLHFDLAILAVLGNGVAGIHDISSVNNMRMSFIGSNPASNSVVVAYDMLQDASARLMVLDAKGSKVIDQQLGRTSAGEHQTTLNVSDWADGTYYVSMFANGAPITKKLMVAH